MLFIRQDTPKTVRFNFTVIEICFSKMVPKIGNTGGSLNSRVLQFADPPIRGLFFVTQIPQFAAKNLQFAVFSAIFRKIWQARDQNLK